MCNCKDEHIASVSCKGDLIVHGLVSGAKVAELKDPEGQVAYTISDLYDDNSPFNMHPFAEYVFIFFLYNTNMIRSWWRSTILGLAGIF